MSAVDAFTPGPGLTVFSLRPPQAVSDRLHADGVWRDATVLDDLRRWRDETPDELAIIARRIETGATTWLTFREFAQRVERFAGALTELGVGPGQVVALQLPNLWQVSALLLACFRVGAVAAPIMATIRSRELERVLARVGASVCVTMDEWAGFGHAASLAEMAPRLPRLRHRVVLGSHVEADELDFAEYFEQTPWETRHEVALDRAEADPDQVSLVLFSSGTTGEPKAALHTVNTYAATAAPFARAYGRDHRFYTPHSLTHGGGIVTSVFLPLLAGGCAVIADVWAPEAVCRLVDEFAVTFIAAAPVFWTGLLEQGRSRPGALKTVRAARTFGTTVPAPLVAEVFELVGVPLRSDWGMTEAGGTMMPPDDPIDWAAHSVGRVLPGSEVELRADHEITEEQPGRLFIRGGTVCLATVGRDTGGLIVLADHDNGWYDTGDLAVWDGRGGFRIMGRAADRIGGVFMIPVTDVESALLGHPAVADVALVGYPDGAGGELAAAVVVSREPGLALDDLRDHLAALGMTEWYWPSRLELVDALPRNAMGKVQKAVLARRLVAEPVGGE